VSPHQRIVRQIDHVDLVYLTQPLELDLHLSTSGSLHGPA
jgi:hypothetical protein